MSVPDIRTSHPALLFISCIRDRPNSLEKVDFFRVVPWYLIRLPFSQIKAMCLLTGPNRRYRLGYCLPLAATNRIPWSCSVCIIFIILGFRDWALFCKRVPSKSLAISFIMVLCPFVILQV